MTELSVGKTLTASRTFTEAMVEAWLALSQDAGRHHVEPNENGQIVVHGLLVASLATEIGGRLSYLARELDFEFLKPVFTGDTITCTVRIDEIVPEERRTRLRLSGEAVNQSGLTVMRVRSSGIVR